MLIVTDSGGSGREAASLCKPVLILREVTERPEVVEAGFGELVGTDVGKIVWRSAAWMEDAEPPGRIGRPGATVGDGHAAEKIVSAIELLGRERAGSRALSVTLQSASEKAEAAEAEPEPVTCGMLASTTICSTRAATACGC